MKESTSEREYQKENFLTILFIFLLESPLKAWYIKRPLRKHSAGVAAAGSAVDDKDSLHSPTHHE